MNIFSPNYSILYGDTISQSKKADGKLPKTETASWNVLKFRITATPSGTDKVTGNLPSLDVHPITTHAL